MVYMWNLKHQKWSHDLFIYFVDNFLLKVLILFQK